MAGLPDHWFASAEQFGAGGPASITLATPLIPAGYVVTAIRATLGVQVALGAPFSTRVQITDGVGVVFIAALAGVQAVTDFAELGQEMNLVITPGRPVIAAFVAPSVAGLVQDIAIQGYVI